ncbi:MarR family winged helix-turn-helix transcriptional regulator [Rubrivivax gelatinosus]|uniref:DNA-binding MarR family transcriptional regulator n=1 Tax=Rubrivivax gelatinosus TaxID=28068 RepID=A0A4R2LYP7_RUBGE|nr:MarR family winged helix-turn-helix transcriptional regulator [Rubrivivax gelatinosus]MBK1688007.1 MarR family transcriptional regulator [Rubrivivax gelatinosus]TCO99291.1 DNA-binding MarR family transcriptional regulator [Rubrivivax gelatinosus]
MKQIRSSPAASVSDLMTAAQRLQARRLARAHTLLAPLGLTGARWQLLDAIVRAGEPQSAPQLAATLGLTRQGVQKQLDLLAADGLLGAQPNPRHRRSPRYGPGAAGQRLHASASALQAAWDARLAAGLPAAELADALGILKALHARLDDSLPVSPAG